MCKFCELVNVTGNNLYCTDCIDRLNIYVNNGLIKLCMDTEGNMKEVNEMFIYALDNNLVA